MSEQKIIKNQLIKNMMFNLIAFTIIFSIFGLVIYGQFSNSLYKSADEELLNSKNKLDFLENNNKEDMPNRGMRDNNSKPDEPKTKTGMNPRLIYLIRDEDGNVTGNGNIGYIYTDEYKNEKPSSDLKKGVENGITIVFDRSSGSFKNAPKSMEIIGGNRHYHLEFNELTGKVTVKQI